MIRQNNKQLSDRQELWHSDELFASLTNPSKGRPEAIVTRIAQETAEKVRAIFSREEGVSANSK